MVNVGDDDDVADVFAADKGTAEGVWEGKSPSSYQTAGQNRKAIVGKYLLANLVERLESSQIDSAIGYSGRCGNRFAHVVLGQNLELGAGLDDRDDPVAGGQIDLAVGVQRRGAMPIASRPLLVKFLACFRVDADEIAVFATQIDQTIVIQRRWHIGCADIAPPMK